MTKHLLVWSIILFAQTAVASDVDTLSDFLGVYEFEDEVVVSGGRMDEGGSTFLIYIDTETVARAGLFEREDDADYRTFRGLFGGELSFDDNGREMFWTATGGETMKARRVLQPDKKAAAFSSGGVTLRGTLYFPPHASKPVPAVVLAHGSGPVTRYAGTWISFFVAQGIAVLSYDKRGAGESGGDWRKSTYQGLAQDVVAAGEWLSEQEFIDSNMIGLHTSSQSGWYGPWVVANADHFSFLIQRAGPAVNIGIGTAHEYRHEWEADGLSTEAISEASTFWIGLHQLAKEGASLNEANRWLAEAKSEEWFEPAFGEWQEITSAWWRLHASNMQFEPARTVAKLEVPVLWFLAEKDENVPYLASQSALAESMKAKPDLELVTIENATHSFVVTAPDGAQHYTDQYWSRMREWLQENGIKSEN